MRLGLVALFACFAGACTPRATQASCNAIRSAEPRDAVERANGPAVVTSGDIVQYGSCSKHQRGVCCVAYDGDVVLEASWTPGCACSRNLARAE